MHWLLGTREIDNATAACTAKGNAEDVAVCFPSKSRIALHAERTYFPFYARGEKLPTTGLWAKAIQTLDNLNTTVRSINVETKILYLLVHSPLLCLLCYMPRRGTVTKPFWAGWILATAALTHFHYAHFTHKCDRCNWFNAFWSISKARDDHRFGRRSHSI